MLTMSARPLCCMMEITMGVFMSVSSNLLDNTLFSSIEAVFQQFKGQRFLLPLVQFR